MSDWQSAPEVASQDQTPAPAVQASWMNAPEIDAGSKTEAAKPDRSSFLDELKQPFKGESLGSLLKQNMFVNMARYVARSTDLQPDLEKQYDAGKADGSITEEFGPWMTQHLADAYQKQFSEKPPEIVPQVEWKQLPKQIYDQATKHPALFVSEMAKAFVVDPQLAFLPELGVAKRVASAGQAAEKVARAGEVAAEMGGQSAAISTARQLSESGDVQAPAVEQEAASGAVAGLALSMLHSAASLGVEAIAKRKGATVTPEIREQVQKEMTDAMDAGVSPTDALAATLEKHGMPRREATRMGDAIEPYVEKETSNATDKEGSQGQVSNAEGVRNEQGQEGLLREREQGVDQGSGEKAQEVAPADAQSADNAVQQATPPVGETVAQPPSKLVEQSSNLAAAVDAFKAARDNPSSPGVAEASKAVPRPEPYKEEVPPVVSDYTVTADQARDIFESAGMTPEEATRAISKRTTIAGEMLERKLSRFMGGDKFAQPVIREFINSTKQAGRADTKVLASLGLAGIGGLAAYTLTGDKTKAIAAAAAAGLLPFAGAIAGRLRAGVKQIDRAIGTDKRFDTKSIFRNHYRDVQVGNYAVGVWERGVKAMLTGEKDVKGSYQRIRDYTQGHRDVQLSPREQAAATELRKFLDYMGERGAESKVLGELLENYLPGLYQKKPFASWRDVIAALTQDDAFRGNYTGMSPSSRHALKKVIPDYRTVEALIKQGKLDLVPLTDNPFEMAAVYGRALNKTIANRRLVDTLKATPGPNTRTNAKGDEVPVPLVVPITTRDAAARIAQGNAIKVKEFGLEGDEAEHTKEIWNRFDIMRAPKDYVTISNPALEGLRVHRDIAQPLKMLFDTSDPGTATRSLYAISMGAKSALFSFSLFHAGALLQVGATTASRHPFLMGRSLRGARNFLLSTKFEPEVAHWLEHGLTLAHGVQDVDPSFFQRATNLAEKYAAGLPLYAGTPVVAGIKGMRFAHKAINDFMWGTLQPTLKLATAMAEEKRWVEKNPDGDRAKASREIAEGVNTLYGGINWFEMANNVEGNTVRTLATALYSPQGRRWQQILLLSPDWLHASLRAWTEGAKAAMPGLDAKASDSMYRSYLLMSGLTYLGVAQYLQQKFTGENLWDKPDWTYVDMGDGRKIQLNKHFMEMVHLLSNPGKFIVNKLNYIPKETLAQLFHKEYITVDKTGSLGGPPMQGNRITHAAKAFASPITIQNLLNDPANAVAGMVGIPIYGSTYEAQEARARSQAHDAGKDEEKAAARVRRRAAKAESQRHGSGK